MKGYLAKKGGGRDALYRISTPAVSGDTPRDASWRSRHAR